MPCIHPSNPRYPSNPGHSSNPGHPSNPQPPVQPLGTLPTPPPPLTPAAQVCPPSVADSAPPPAPSHYGQACSRSSRQRHTLIQIQSNQWIPPIQVQQIKRSRHPPILCSCCTTLPTFSSTKSNMYPFHTLNTHCIPTAVSEHTCTCTLLLTTA